MKKTNSEIIVCYVEYCKQLVSVSICLVTDMVCTLVTVVNQK